MREYSDATRRFAAAEREFIAAKLDLHTKRELKEQLTEHLMIIIQEVGGWCCSPAASPHPCGHRTRPARRAS